MSPANHEVDFSEVALFSGLAERCGELLARRRSIPEGSANIGEICVGSTSDFCIEKAVMQSKRPSGAHQQDI